ncbi:hypothetical protein QFC21_006466 [Naganishia friedmannii]|uniref:Uncharacterized protein n=1 Tax=Naganishia friedmannii TaxID=89922 RepID=A0ACC2V3D1_9TREE|nr:hypothetical protein QFC21_006466 [Naganishia friedmannii]
MFAQSTKFNRAPPDMHRDRSAPMDFDFEKPRDPGVFGSIPHKRQHIETIDGQSTWTPGPYSTTIPNTTHLPPAIHGGPMLFAQPPPSYVRPGKEQDFTGDTSIGTMMDVDTSMRVQDHEPRDIDMWSDSPAKTARNSAETDTHTVDSENAASQPESTDRAKPTLLSSILRPINPNAVKRVEKQRSKAQHQQQRRSGDRAVSAGAVSEGAVVLRAAEGEEEHGLFEDEDSDELSDEEENFDNIPQTSTPALLRKRRPHQRRGDHISAGQPTGNRYTLNLFGAGNGQQAALGVVPSPSHLEYMQDSKGKLNHSEVPYILLGYLQFIFNASIVGVCLYLVLMFIWTIRNDVKERMATYSSGKRKSLSACDDVF